MLYLLTQYLETVEGAFRVFNYLTFRAILSVLTALVSGRYALSGGPIRAVREDW